MAKKGHIRWTRDTLRPTLAAFVIRANVAMEAAVRELAQSAEEYMQQNAPWEDITGEARDGLTARAEHGLTQSVIHLYHTAEHGIWLEIRWNGRWAIIQPTVEHYDAHLVWPFFRTMFPAATIGRGL